MGASSAKEGSNESVVYIKDINGLEQVPFEGVLIEHYNKPQYEIQTVWSYS